MDSIEGVEVEFIKGSGGVFEVKKDGIIIHSKARTGNFPDEEALVGKLS